MITYDLQCQNGHEFEGWFKDRKNFEKQLKKKLIECPLCGDRNVKMILTGCAIKTKSDRKAEEIKKKMLDIVKIGRELSDYARDHFKYVGSDFPEEARKIHRGDKDIEGEGIWGTTTPEEEKELKEEGVKFFKIPKPKKYDS